MAWNPLSACTSASAALSSAKHSGGLVVALLSAIEVSLLLTAIAVDLIAALTWSPERSNESSSRSTSGRGIIVDSTVGTAA